MENQRSEPDDEAAARREAARLLGRARSPAKAAASAQNGRLGGRPEGTKLPPETRAKMSEAQRLAWQRRKAEGRTSNPGRTGPEPKPLSEIPCTCAGGGDSTEASAHKATCARKRAFLRRERGDPTAVPLHLLDTDANRELLRCLLLTMEAARDVDKERGHDGDGFAEVIEHFAANVATQIHGPADLRQEDRRA